MTLPAKPHTAAEYGSRQCSQPGARVSKDRHPKGWLMAQSFEGPMVVSSSPKGEICWKGLRRVRLRDCCSRLGTSGHLWEPVVGIKGSGGSRQWPVLQPVSDIRVCRQLWWHELPTQHRARRRLCTGCSWSPQVKVAMPKISHSSPCPGPQETFRGNGDDGEDDPSSVLMAARPPGFPVTVTSTGAPIQFSRPSGKREAKEGCVLFFSSPPSHLSFH